MHDYHNFSCFIIGEGSLPIQCTQILLEYGHHIYGLISPDPKLQQWASKTGLPHSSPLDDPLTILRQQPFDYLFSIVNSWVLPTEILSVPLEYAINYHDAPLPKYAGVHATSWAIMQRETTHGVTWHVMTETVDAGDILKQPMFDISPDETAVTLNIKCYEAAVHSFRELVEDLAYHQIVPFPQKLTERTYFPLYHRPPAGCVFSWHQDAENIDAFVRALTFGPYPNRLGMPKCMMGQDVLIVPHVDVLESTSKVPAGTITDIDDTTMSIATRSHDIALHELFTIDGQVLSLRDLVRQYQIQSGDQLREFEPDMADRLTAITSQICQHESFWVNRLSTLQPLELPYVNRVTPAGRAGEQTILPFAIPHDVTTFLHDHSCKPGDVLFSAFVVYLARLTEMTSFDIGLTSCALSRNLRGLPGFFAPYVPLHITLDPTKPFASAHHTIQSYITRTIQKHSYVRDVGTRYPELSSPPRFSVMITQVETLSDDHADFADGLNCVISQDGLACQWEYHPHTLHPDHVRRMATHFLSLLQNIPVHPEQPLWQLPFLTSLEQHQILVEWNDTAAEYPRDTCIHQLFEEQVEHTPDAIAVIFEEQQLSYRELNIKANQLARYLRKVGVKPETLVGICVERSVEMVVGLLGILKAGGAYVPFDPSYPHARLTFMLEDSHVAVLLTKEKWFAEFSESLAYVVCLDTHWEIIAQELQHNPVSHSTPKNAMYVIYTSGSTGTPKGVLNTHRALCNRLRWMQETYQLTGEDRVLQKTPLSFDVSGWEIFWPLLTGARLILAVPEGQKDSSYLAKLIAEQQITALHFVPSMLRVFLEEPGFRLYTSLQRVFCGGEALPFDLKKRFFERISGVELHNLYGPTEAAIDVTFWDCQQNTESDIVPIGRPIANTQIHILDQHLQPVPANIPGELHIGGIALARGYFKRPDLTAEKFIPNPFSEQPGERLYKTGDLARYLPDGNIEFLGRLDHQVKIRGFRIELGEIEVTLNQHPAVREAIVLAREDHPGSKQLVAYVVEAQDQKYEVKRTELRSYLKERLPAYMVPAAFVSLKTLALSPNGKVDFRALPAPAQTRPDLGNEYVPPRNDTEHIITTIWEENLNIQPVGIYDNFFELGGDSLLAIRMIFRLNEFFHVDLHAYCVFELLNIAAIAHSMEILHPKEYRLHESPILPASREDPLPLSFQQQQLWLLTRLDPEQPVYNETFTIRPVGKIDVAGLEQSFSELIRRHEILRTTFAPGHEEPIQCIHPPEPFLLKKADLRELPESVRETEALRLAAEYVKQPFDLSQGPLLRAFLICLENEDFRLFTVFHHIVTDAISMYNVFLPELEALYKAFSIGQVSPLKEITLQYADFAVWQRQQLQKAILNPHLAYWKKKLTHLPKLQLPIGRPNLTKATVQGARQCLSLSRNLTDQLKTLSKQEGATLFMTLATAVNILLFRYSTQEDISIGTATAGRNWPEVEEMMGYFLNIVVLRTDLSGNPTFQELLGRVRQLTIEAYAHQDVPFNMVVAALQPKRTFREIPLFQVAFIFEPSLPEDRLEWNVSQSHLCSGTAKFDLLFELEERTEGIIGLIEYKTDLFDSETISRMIGHFQTLLEGIVNTPKQSIAALALLSWAERHQLLVEWNRTESDYPKDRCLHQLFEAQVERSPDAVAVVFDNRQLTYRELNIKANQLAHYLRLLGVGTETLVGLCIERSLEMVIGLLGILKASGAYVPLDPSYPQDRLAFMLTDTRAPIVLTQDKFLAVLPSHGTKVVCLDKDWTKIFRERPKKAIDPVESANLAYVIYTSGSTGIPKGVAVSHQAINRLVSDNNYVKWGSFDRVAQASTLSFDAATFEIWGALLHGACLVGVSKESVLTPEKFVKQIRVQALNVLFITTALFNQLVHNLPGIFQSVRDVLFGGEAVDPRWVRALMKESPPERLLHVYGPTESTTFTSWYLVQNISEEATNIPIGRPIANTQVYLLNNSLQPVAIGVPGELYIGGDGLARGYLFRPELTAECFIPNPFSDTLGERLYKTGDLARYLPDGNIEFLGRQDHQVKIRGFRIELGEIEVVLEQHPSIHQAVVIVREDIPQQPRLVAYVVPRQKSPPTAGSLRQFLRQKLPEYMIPSAFVFLDKLPLSPNGKIDRKTLPEPKHTRPEFEERFIPPSTPVEDELAQIWCHVFQLDRVGIQDNFFALGGHSLLATQVISRVNNRFGLEIPLSWLFEMPTIASFARAIVQQLIETLDIEELEELLHELGH